MKLKCPSLVSFGWLLLASPAVAQVARYDLSTRVELHMLPAVTTGPLDPAWRPDGAALAYSMRGDIWTFALGTDEARAITKGPAYHFEPDWSPDGQYLAMSVDFDGNLDIAVVGQDGTGFRRITSHPAVDIQPAWTPDGEHILFASARSGSFDVLRIEVASGTIDTMVSGRGHQFQPAPSPSGRKIAYVSAVPDRLGSGGIWSLDMAGGEPFLIHYEETSYRPAPTWTPDGSAIIYASDAAGSYDLATVPANGGNPVRLTTQPLDEFAPAVSPDGQLVAFVANHSGPTRLYVASRFGSADRNWDEIVPKRFTPLYETARIRGRIVGPDGAVTPARIHLLGADGRGYTPEGGFHRVSPANEIHYFHNNGTFEVTVPVGTTRIEAVRGFEWIPADVTVDAVAGETVDVELRLERLSDPGAQGWVSGDTHVHDLHEGRYALSQPEYFDQLRADDLHVTNDLIHMDGTKIMGRWSDLTGEDYAGSTDDYILRYTQEFRGSFGHVGLLGVSEFIMPLIGGTRGSPYPSDGLKLMYLDSIAALGGIGGFLHPYNGDVSTAQGASQSDIPVHAVLGRGDFFDVVSIASDELASAAMYYHVLNVGVRLAATGGTDNFSNVWRDPSGGTARTYARLDGPLSWRNWIEAVRAGRTMATNGPLLFATIDGAEPGSELLPTNRVSVSAEILSITPVEVIEVIVDGRVVASQPVPNGGTRMNFEQEIETEGARWIAVRVRGGKERYSGDNYTFAHTSPVYFAGSKANAASEESASFLEAVFAELWRRVDQRDAWVNRNDRETYRGHLDEALRRLRAN